MGTHEQYIVVEPSNGSGAHKKPNNGYRIALGEKEGGQKAESLWGKVSGPVAQHWLGQP